MARPLDRRLTRECAAARGPLTIAGILGVIEAALIVAQAVLLATVIARGALGGRSLGSLRSDLIALAAVLVARGGVRAGFELSGRVGATRVMSELRRRLVARLLVVTPGARPRDTSTGELAASAVSGVDALEAYFAGYLPQLILAGVVPVAVLGWAAVTDPLAAAILAGTVPLLIVFMVLVGKGTAVKTRRRHAALARLSGHFLDVVTGLETLRAYRREAAQEVTLSRVGDDYRRETMATLRLAFLSALVLELCAMLGTAMVAATVGVELCAGALTLQAGLTVLLLAPELYGPLREVGQQFHAGADATAAAERIFAAIDHSDSTAVRVSPRAPSRIGAAVPDPRRQAIRFWDVSFAYSADRGPALDDLWLSMEPGSTTVLSGPSGAGKSTVARLLLGLAVPTSGRIRVGGVDLRAVDLDAWRAQIAWLPQDPTLFTATIADNVRLGADADDDAVRAALGAAGLGPVVDALPDGLGTLIGDGGRRLSAGQRRRVGLARAFLRDAPLLILDEPTAHLDSDTAAQIAATLSQLLTGRTVLLITHDRSLHGLADQMVSLHDGHAEASLSTVASAAAVERAA